MAAESTGKGLLFNSTATTTAQNTNNVETGEYVSGAFQVQTDGTQTVTVALQASNVPGQEADMGPAYVRNETATSTDYATLSTSTVATGTGTQNLMLPLATIPYRVVRLLLSTSSGTSAIKVYFHSAGYPS